MKKIVLVFSLILSGLTVNAQEIQADVLAKKMEKQPLLIDVRTAEEYKDGSITGAVNMNVHSDEFRRSLEKLSREKEIILFCQSGERSNEALEMLREMGFQNVSQLAGGYQIWQEQMGADRSN